MVFADIWLDKSEYADQRMPLALAVIKALQANGPKPDEIASLKELERRELEIAEKQNGYWLGSLQLVHQLGFDPLRVARRAERIDLLTADNLHEAFKSYLSPDRWTRVTLWPETANGTGAAKPAKP